MWISNFIKHIVVFVSLSLLFSCQKSYQDPISPKNWGTEKDLFVNINKSIYQSEELKIDSFIRIINQPFVKDKTGVRIYIDPNDSHSVVACQPEDGSFVTISYKCFSLDDYVSHTLDSTINYNFSNFKMDTISFKIGSSKQMRGLIYSIKLLEVGDKAKIIIPSYLGFGMSGYFDEVKPYETLILSVELLNVK